MDPDHHFSLREKAWSRDQVSDNRQAIRSGDLSIRFAGIRLPFMLAS